MPRISCSEMTTYRWSFEEDVAGYIAAGVSTIGVWRRKLAEFGEERGCELLQDSGLSASSLSCAGGFTGGDGQTFCEAVDEALDAVRLAAELRARCLVVVTGGRAGHTGNHARNIVVDALQTLGDAGAALGVQIAVQPLLRQPHDRSSFLTSLSAALDLVDRCEHAQVGLALDVLWACERLAAEPVALEAGVSPGRFVELARFVKLAAICEAPAAVFTHERGQAFAEAVCQLERGGYRGAYEMQVLCEKSWNALYPRLLSEYLAGLAETCPGMFAEPRPARIIRPEAAAPAAASLN